MRAWAISIVGAVVVVLTAQLATGGDIPFWGCVVLGAAVTFVVGALSDV